MKTASSASPPVLPRPPRSAASVVVVRDRPTGMEVLLLRRVEREGDRSSGACVFPGGTLDPHDRELHACVVGLGDADASARLSLPAHGLDFHIAAIRECFEEAGLLFACDAAGELVALDGLDAAELIAWRASAQQGGIELQRLCERRGWRLAADRLAYFGHFLTPPGLPKRFDARFFIALAPDRQTAAHDDRETDEHLWIRPADAIDPVRGVKVVPITRHLLQSLTAFDSASACFDHARQLKRIELVMPRLARGAAGQRPVMPHEPAYAEIARIDPDGSGEARYELRPGPAVRLSDRVLRVTAPNGSVMTGPGTNSYFVGGGARNEWALIDPGPDDDAHVAALLAAAPGPVRWIFATHTHKDHSPATTRLRAATGARVFGRTTPHPEWQDTTFQPDEVLSHGDVMHVGDATLRVVHTPGHASNHLCYLLEEEKTLFTGDHVMQGSTVVVSPPDGDMSAYLASLDLLLREDIDWLAPGHGFLMAKPHDAVRALVRHRLRREAKVVRVLGELGAADLDRLVLRVYDDVPERMHVVARRSLHAHLLKLAGDGAAVETGGQWELIARSPRA